MDNSQPIFQRSPDTELLIKFLRSMKVGAVATYDELMVACNRTTMNDLRAILNTARKCLESEAVFFTPVCGEGMRRISESDSLQCSADRRIRAARMARRSKKCLSAIPAEKYASFSTEDKAKWNAEMLLASIQERAGSSKMSEKMLESTEKAPQHKMELGAVLDLMK